MIMIKSIVHQLADMYISSQFLSFTRVFIAAQSNIKINKYRTYGVRITRLLIKLKSLCLPHPKLFSFHSRPSFTYSWNKCLCQYLPTIVNSQYSTPYAPLVYSIKEPVSVPSGDDAPACFQGPSSILPSARPSSIHAAYIVTILSPESYKPLS